MKTNTEKKKREREEEMECRTNEREKYYSKLSRFEKEEERKGTVSERKMIETEG